MLKALGVTHVILGHSERRHVFGESDELINRKVARRAQASPDADPVRRRDPAGARRRPYDRRRRCARSQNGLAGIDGRDAARAIIAYEPVWAIGTGRTATPEQAALVHGVIREAIGDSFGPERAAGGANPLWRQRHGRKCRRTHRQPDIDGALVGGASLKADSFARIVRARVGLRAH